MKQLHRLESLTPDTPTEFLYKALAITYQAPKEAVELMTKAIRDRPGFVLARIMRANAEVYQAMDQGGNMDLIREAFKDLEIASESNMKQTAQATCSRFCSWRLRPTVKARFRNTTDFGTPMSTGLQAAVGIPKCAGKNARRT